MFFFFNIEISIDSTSWYLYWHLNISIYCLLIFTSQIALKMNCGLCNSTSHKPYPYFFYLSGPLVTIELWQGMFYLWFTWSIDSKAKTTPGELKWVYVYISITMDTKLSSQSNADIPKPTLITRSYLLWQLSVIAIVRGRVTPFKFAGRLTRVIICIMYYVTLNGLYSEIWIRYHEECLHDKLAKLAYVVLIGFVNDQACQLRRGLLIYCR